MLRGILVPQSSLAVNPVREKISDRFSRDTDDGVATTAKKGRETQPKIAHGAANALCRYCTCLIAIYSILMLETFGDSQSTRILDVDRRDVRDARLHARGVPVPQRARPRRELQPLPSSPDISPRERAPAVHSC
jgi:hypothetical protein